MRAELDSVYFRGALKLPWWAATFRRCSYFIPDKKLFPRLAQQCVQDFRRGGVRLTCFVGRDAQHRVYIYYLLYFFDKKKVRPEGCNWPMDTVSNTAISFRSFHPYFQVVLAGSKYPPLTRKQNSRHLVAKP